MLLVMQTPQAAHLNALGYSSGWSALLSAEDVADAHGRLLRGELSDTRGLRRSSFKRHIRASALDAAAVTMLMALIAEELSSSVQTAALKELIRSPRLDRWRLEVLKLHPLVAARGLREEVHRCSLLRGLAEPDPDPEVQAAALASGDTSLHEALLALPVLDAALVDSLVRSGASKAIRRAARARAGGPA